MTSPGYLQPFEHEGTFMVVVQEYMDGSFIAEDYDVLQRYMAFDKDRKPLGPFRDDIDEASRDIDKDMI